jgi:simple sugar transport system ATP-binding protein
MVTVFRDARYIVTAPVAELGRADLVAAMTSEAAASARYRHPRPSSHGRTERPRPGRRRLSRRQLPDRGWRDRRPRGRRRQRAHRGSRDRRRAAAATAGEVEIAGNRPRPGSVPAALASGFIPRGPAPPGLRSRHVDRGQLPLSVPRRPGPNGFLSRSRRDRIAEGLIENLAIKTAGPELPVSALSGGNQRKVVMADDPRLLVLINLTAGVDGALQGVPARQGRGDRGNRHRSAHRLGPLCPLPRSRSRTSIPVSSTSPSACGLRGRWDGTWNSMISTSRTASGTISALRG